MMDKENIINSQQNEGIIHFIKFTLFSISAGIIQIISFAILNQLMHFRYWPSYLVALILSVLWNFTLNRKYTFKSAANIPKAMFKVGIYYLIFTPLSTWWGDRLVDGHHWPEFVVLLGTMVINFVTEFMYTKYIVYRNQINSAIEK